MKRGEKVARPDITALTTQANRTIWLSDGQMVYETPKTYELWQETPELRFIARWRKRHLALVWQGERYEQVPD